jgi:hypothetical protein
MEVSFSMDDRMKQEDNDEGLNDLSFEEVTRMWDEGEPVELGTGPFTLGVVTLKARPGWLVGVGTVDASASTVGVHWDDPLRFLEGEGFTPSSRGRPMRERSTEIGQKLVAAG